MSTTLKVITHTFNEHPVTTYIFDGRPCWVALEVGRAIGYGRNGKGLVELITGKWSSELLEGSHYETLSGKRLKNFMELLEVDGQRTPSSAPQMTVLYETGLWLVLTKTHRPAGKVLRRELAEKVLPQLARDGRYLPEREVTPQGVMVETAHARRMRELDVEEKRLALMEREMTIREAGLKAASLRRVANLVSSPEDAVHRSLLLKAEEVESGADLTVYLPPAPESLSWESPTQIGKRIGVSANAVGKAITALGLRGAEGKSREIVNKATHSDRTVTSWLYSPAAVAEIEVYLRR